MTIPKSNFAKTVTLVERYAPKHIYYSFQGAATYKILVTHVNLKAMTSQTLSTKFCKRKHFVVGMP